MTAWRDNDTLFFSELAEGRRWELHVASLLLELGLWVHVPPRSIRGSIYDVAEYADEADLWVGRHNPQKIEVKSRRLEFSSKDDYPDFAIPAFVTTVDSWCQAATKPKAIVIVSRTSGCAIAIPGKSYERWTIQRRYDRIRNIEEAFLCAPRSCFYDLPALAAAIKRQGV